MNRFEKVTKDIDSFVEWGHVNSHNECLFYINSGQCTMYNGFSCKEGIKKHFEEIVK